MAYTGPRDSWLLDLVLSPGAATYTVAGELNTRGEKAFILSLRFLVRTEKMATSALTSRGTLPSYPSACPSLAGTRACYWVIQAASLRPPSLTPVTVPRPLFVPLPLRFLTIKANSCLPKIPTDSLSHVYTARGGVIGQRGGPRKSHESPVKNCLSILGPRVG